MKPQPLNFERMNESNVREEVTSVMLRELGYRSGTSCDIITELALKWPNISLGRRKPSDPALRGRADYVLEVDGRLRWVIEVKPPSEALGDEVRAQAWTYAIHPEVKAIYFLVTNGQAFELYRSVEGPRAGPILAFNYEEMNEYWQRLSNIVGPSALRRDYARFVLDTGAPLAPGLRSFAKITGRFKFTSVKTQLPGMDSVVGQIGHIEEGVIQRDGEKIVAFMRISSGRAEIDDANQVLGLDTFDVTSEDRILSGDPDHPTLFSKDLDWVVPKGTLLPIPNTQQKYALPIEMTVRTRTTGSGVFRNGNFTGEMLISMNVGGAQVTVAGEVRATLS